MKIVALAAVVVMMGVLGYVILTEGGTEPLPLPDIPGVTHVEVFVDFDVQVVTGGAESKGSEVGILDHTVTKREINVTFSVGPLWLGYGETRNGEIVVKAVKDGRMVSQLSQSWELQEDLWWYTTSGVFSFSGLKLGELGSGAYTVRAIVYDETGQVDDTDEARVTI